MLAILLDSVLAYLIYKRGINNLQSTIAAFLGGTMIAAITTIGVEVFVERKPAESIVQFLVGCLLHPIFILLLLYFFRRKQRARQAIQEEQRQDETDYSRAIQALLDTHKHYLDREVVIDPDFQDRLERESTDVLIDKVRNEYFRDEALPAVLQILKSRIR